MRRTTRHSYRPRPMALGAAFALGSLLGVSTAAIAQTPSDGVPLGTAAPFVILAATGVTNSGATTLHGDVGSHPDGSFTGTTSVVHTGTNHADSEVTRIAKDDLVVAYDTAAGAATTETISADLGGRSLVAGVYTAPSTMALTGTLTLVGDGDDVFIFQAGSSLITEAASAVTLDGVDPCNVYWQVGSSATLGTGTDFVGNILAMTSITLDTGATVDGRVLARNGTVTLLSNTIDASMCIAATGDGDTDGGTDGDTEGGTDETDGGTPDGGADTTDGGTDETDGGTPDGSADTTGGSSDGTDGGDTPTPPTGSGSATGTATGTGTTDGGETTSQVTDVPKGGVDAGDGSAINSSPTNAPLQVFVLLAAIAAVATVTARRPRLTA